MTALDDACNELRQILTRADAERQDLLTRINVFEKYTGSYALNRLWWKLMILKNLIIENTRQLYEEHGFHGYVCVFLGEKEGITVHWVEDKKIVDNKSRFASYGLTVLSYEEANDLIDQFIENLNSNNWPKVVDWLNRYGKSPGLDFSKLP